LIPKPLDQIANVELKDVLTYIQEETFGRVLTLSAEPTSAIPLIQDNEGGVYNSIYYRRVGNVIYKFTPTSTISVT